jgi:hypothetical protein
MPETYLQECSYHTVTFVITRQLFMGMKVQYKDDGIVYTFSNKGRVIRKNRMT